MTSRPFGLRDDPFAEGYDRRLVYPHRTHRESVERLARAIEQHAPVVLLTGAAGAGKTTTLATLLASAGEITRIEMTGTAALGVEEVWRRLAEAIGSAEVAGSGEALAARLAARDTGASALVLAIDDAHELGSPVLDELRVLSTVASGGHAALTVLLVGRSPLDKRIEQPECEGLRNAIAARGRLESMTARETESLIHHRVSVCGGPGALFPRPTCRAIHEHARGIARDACVLAGEALAEAGAAGAQAVETAHVSTAIEKLGRGASSVSKSPKPAAAEPKTAEPNTTGSNIAVADPVEAPEPKTAVAAPEPIEAAQTKTPEPAPAQATKAPAPAAAAPEPAPVEAAPPEKLKAEKARKPKPSPAVASKPAPAPKPAVASKPASAPKPAPASKPMSVPKPAPVATKSPAAAAAPKPAPAPGQAAEPKPAPKPAASASEPLRAPIPEEVTYVTQPVEHTPAIDAWLSRFNDAAGPPRIGSRVAVDDSTTELAHPKPIESAATEGADGEALPPAPRIKPRRGRVVGRGPLRPSRYARRSTASAGWVVAAAVVAAIGAFLWLHRAEVLARISSLSRAGTRKHATVVAAPAPVVTHETEPEPEAAMPAPEPTPPPRPDVARVVTKTSRVTVMPLAPRHPLAPPHAPASPDLYEPANPESTPKETTSSDTTPHDDAPISATIERHYRVIVGTYLVPDRAHEERDRIAGLTSFPCKVLKGHEDGADVFRVLVGPFATREEAESASEQLSSTGSVAEARVVGWFGPKAPRD